MSKSIAGGILEIPSRTFIGAIVRWILDDFRVTSGAFERAKLKLWLFVVYSSCCGRKLDWRTFEILVLIHIALYAPQKLETSLLE